MGMESPIGEEPGPSLLLWIGFTSTAVSLAAPSSQSLDFQPIRCERRTCGVFSVALSVHKDLLDPMPQPFAGILFYKVQTFLPLPQVSRQAAIASPSPKTLVRR